MTDIDKRPEQMFEYVEDNKTYEGAREEKARSVLSK
jgi:hypothetical protein